MICRVKHPVSRLIGTADVLLFPFVGLKVKFEFCGSLNYTCAENHGEVNTSHENNASPFLIL